MQGKLIIFSAPSGSGKTTIVRHLLNIFPSLAFSVSATTRKPRINEKDGIDYYFFEAETFKNKINRDEFLEWEEVYAGQYYGTMRSEVERLRSEGRHVVFDIDVVGGARLKQEFGSNALALFIQPPSLDVIEKRLRERGTDSEEELEKRVGKAKQELAYAAKFDHILVNDQLDLALKEAEQIVMNFISAK